MTDLTYLTQRIVSRPVCSSRLGTLWLMGAALMMFHVGVATAQWSAPDANGHINSTNSGNVGVGTTTPAAKLHVKGSSASTVNTVQIMRLDSGITHGLDFGALSLSPYAWWIQARDNNGNPYLYPLALNPIGGNVGIGTTNPAEKLEVAGNLKLTGTGNINAAGTIEGGNIKAKYQDVAEWVPSTHALPAGTVVTLDPTKSNHVEASSKAYDTRVAGVISAQPGITLGEGGENKVLVATTGRVKLMVDASKGPIQIGDLLVTSDTPGVAMKSEAINVGGVQIHRPGTLIGKALEHLAKGRGEILVLLSLQ